MVGDHNKSSEAVVRVALFRSLVKLLVIIAEVEEGVIVEATRVGLVAQHLVNLES